MNNRATQINNALLGKAQVQAGELSEGIAPAEADEQPMHIHLRALDIERSKRLELERVGRIKDEFLANLSHELRTPLNAIFGWAEFLKPGKSTEEEMREGLEVIRRNTRVQVRLIDDLLDMSRIISGKLRLDIQQVDMLSIIQAAVDATHLAATAKGVLVETVLDPVAGPVTGDPGRIQQVVLNLLSNAIKFTPSEGTVRVTLERVGSHLELSVRDTGRGISPAFLPELFNRFSQSVSSLPKNNGLGLGLAIVKSLVELHGGAVRATSAGEGYGSTFTVSLPISVVRASQVEQSPVTPSGRIGFATDPQLPGIRVLLVDDDLDALDLVRRVLERCEAVVNTCGSAAECLDLLPTVRPHVLVADINMPEMDGYGLITCVRALPESEGSDVPAVALTAFARSEDRRQAMLSGFDMHIAKPVDPGELVAVVARMAKRAIKLQMATS